MVQPLNKGEWQVAGSIGGPIIKKDSSFNAMPLSSVGLAYGYSQKITAFADLHPSTAYYGVYHIDAGISHELLAPFDLRPGLTYSFMINSFLGRDESKFKIYPQIDLNTYWLMPYRNDFFYLGISNWFELATEKAHGKKQEDHWIPSFHSGYTMQYDQYGFTVELKYLAPFTSNQNLLIDYYSPTDTGSLGVYFSVSRKF